jgi:3-oxoacyl-[acyl-carrier-protein] synthase II
MSPTAIDVVRPVITMWSAVSPFGMDRPDFAAGLRSGADTSVELGSQRWEAADPRACLVPGFEIREVLGKKGTRSMDRVSALAVAAVGRLLDDPAAPATGTEIGLVLGTTTGSAQSMMDFTRTSMTAERPSYVDPAVIPNLVLNCAAGQCAIWYDLKGPNTTVAGGRGAASLAIGYAARLLAAGRARAVLCGAAEEFSHARSWLEHHTRVEEADSGEVVLGEGAAMLLVEPAAVTPRPALAEVLAVDSMVYLDGDVRTTTLACARRALQRAHVAPDEVWAAVAGGLPGTAGRHEREALRELFGEPVLARVPGMSALGDTSAATGAFQIVAALALAEDSPDAAGQAVLATTVDREGTVTCTVLRLAGRPVLP